MIFFHINAENTEYWNTESYFFFFPPESVIFKRNENKRLCEHLFVIFFSQKLVRNISNFRVKKITEDHYIPVTLLQFVLKNIYRGSNMKILPNYVWKYHTLFFLLRFVLQVLFLLRSRKQHLGKVWKRKKENLNSFWAYSGDILNGPLLHSGNRWIPTDCNKMSIINWWF